MQLNKTNYPAAIFDTDVGITGAGVVATSPVTVHRLEQFSGIDPTGTNDCADAINTALALGGAITAAPGSIFKVASTLTMGVAKTHLFGDFTINSTSALTDSTLLNVTGGDCVVEGIRLANPTFSQTQSSAGPDHNCGIRLKSHRNNVLRCNLDGFQNSIAVDAYGEYYDNLIAFNRCTNCIGAGDGPADDTSSYGEDRGDGIVSWGARTRIIGNWVIAKAGQDCRIGIHTEALPTLEVDPGDDSSSMVVIVGNVVKGAFRRGIITEEVHRIVIANNVIGGGQTWWGIGVMAAKNAVVEGNHVTFDRVTSDLSGASWAPRYCGIYVQATDGTKYNEDVTVANNDVIVTDGGGRAYAILGSMSSPTVENKIKFIGNRATALASTNFKAFDISYVNDCQVIGNSIKGAFTVGIIGYDVDRMLVHDNAINGVTDWAIDFENNSTRVSARGNLISSTAKGIAVQPATDSCITDNQFYNVTSRSPLIETWGSTQLQIHNNYCAENDATISFGGGTTKYSVYNNVGFTTDVRIAAASFTDKANWINTWDKYPGKLVSCANNTIYMATGTSDVSTWVPTTSGTPITPA